jgi:hypothetical protein
MRAFTGDELQQGILPSWVSDAVMRGKIPPMPQNHKVSFTLEAVGALRSHIAVQVRCPAVCMHACWCKREMMMRASTFLHPSV